MVPLLLQQLRLNTSGFLYLALLTSVFLYTLLTVQIKLLLNLNLLGSQLSLVAQDSFVQVLGIRYLGVTLLLLLNVAWHERDPGEH